MGTQSPHDRPESGLAPTVEVHLQEPIFSPTFLSGHHHWDSFNPWDPLEPFWVGSNLTLTLTPPVTVAASGLASSAHCHLEPYSGLIPHDPSYRLSTNGSRALLQNLEL